MENQLKRVKICTYSKLSPRQFKEVRHFVERCDESLGHSARFYWDTIQNRKNKSTNEILCHSPEGELIAYLALYHFEEKAIEMTLLIDPRYQQGALYSVLWDRAKHAILRYPIEIKQYVMTCNQQATSHRAYLKKLGAECTEWTYQLAMDSKGFEKLSSLVSACTIEIRQASAKDIPAMLSIELDNFSVNRKSYEGYLKRILKDPSKTVFVAEMDGKMIGKIHLTDEGNHMSLSDFCMSAYHQNKSFGLSILHHAIKGVFEKGFETVTLDVTDEYDLHHYQKWYFECQNTFEHWTLARYVHPVKERVKQLDRLLLNSQYFPMQGMAEALLAKH